MRQLLMIAIIFLGLLFSLKAQTLDYKETITKEINFEKTNDKNVFYLANVSGDILAESYNGNKILVEANFSIRAKTEGRLNRAKEGISLGVIDRLDTILVYVKGNCGMFTKENNNKWDRDNRWHYDWNNCNQGYDIRVDFKIKVPSNQQLYLSTINNGEVIVKNVKSKLELRNINGGIRVVNNSSVLKLHTINGDIDLEDIDLKQGSELYTLNGDINANFSSTINADISFKSFNGELYTNVEDIMSLPVLVKRENSGKDGIKLEVSKRVRLGKGGIEMNFETFNGDVYLKEK